LYAYFENKNWYEEKINNWNQISKETLDLLLWSKSNDFPEQLKIEFVKKFYFDLSPEFQSQFDDVIKKMKEKGLWNCKEEIIFLYANITNYLYKLVCNNSSSHIQNRSCTQKEILNYLNGGKNLIFNSCYREYLGDQKYFKHVYNKYFSSQNINPFERIIILELTGDETISEIKDIIYIIKNKFYNISGIRKNISLEKLVQLKTKLFSEWIIFKDGFDFEWADFSLDSIKESSSVNNKICLKFINNEDILRKIIGENLQQTKEIYQFYINDTILFDIDIKNIEIQIKHISEVTFIL